MSEAVNHPAHYNVGKIEVIDAIEDWGLNFSLGNAVKYIARADHKGKPVEDLEKARWYIEREIERRNAIKTDVVETGAVEKDEKLFRWCGKIFALVWRNDRFTVETPSMGVCDICIHTDNDVEEFPCCECCHADGAEEHFELDSAIEVISE